GKTGARERSGRGGVGSGRAGPGGVRLHHQAREDRRDRSTRRPRAARPARPRDPERRGLRAGYSSRKRRYPSAYASSQSRRGSITSRTRTHAATASCASPQTPPATPPKSAAPNAEPSSTEVSSSGTPSADATIESHRRLRAPPPDARPPTARTPTSVSSSTESRNPYATPSITERAMAARSWRSERPMK